MYKPLILGSLSLMLIKPALAATVNMDPSCSVATDVNNQCQAAFIRAVNQAGPNGTVHFKKGVYNDIGFYRWNFSGQVIYEGFKITGDGMHQVRINASSRGWDFRGMKNVSIENVEIVGASGNQGNLINAGAEAKEGKFNLYRVSLRNAGVDLINLNGFNEVSIVIGSLIESGLAGRKESDGVRPQGSGITISNINKGLINNTYFSATRKVGVLAMLNVNNLTLSNNTFRLRNSGVETAYSPMGGACFYQSSVNNKNIKFLNNQCTDYYVNGIRVMGKGMEVLGNHFNHDKTLDPTCRNTRIYPVVDQYSTKKYAVKREYSSGTVFSKSGYRDNCFGYGWGTPETWNTNTISHRIHPL
ncbi:hypothetical protein [Pseudoalteromonas sp. Of7M-16]|uniref:hypothetical protein n=1 Tax=Pseudoalteromonas sp. Of7M-16 TaxID=2917756 RepID=UPI001EF5A88D|nr:hypothetical protein [Pseudoalteromonas sp. Of7M-16]MCG7547739.1 hypothetical protein [Pseudoalteromonas sp. Of7M-16]